MHSALGLSATEDTISAVLLDVDDDAGSVSPIEERSVQLATAGSGAVGDAVAAAIGVMKLRAARSEQPVGVVGVAYQSEVQRTAIERAISSQGINGVRLVWSESPVLDRGFDIATAAALWATDEARAAGGLNDAGAALVVPVPIVVPPFASRWRNLPRSLVVAAVAATVLGGSVASAIALGAIGGQQEPVVQVGAASSGSTANASPAASGAASSARASVATEAPEVDETTVAYVPPARPESQAEPIPPAPAVVPEPPATVAAPPPASAAEAPAGTSSATRVPAVTPPAGNTSGSGGSGGSGPRATTTTPIPTTTTTPSTTTVEPTTTTSTSDGGDPPGPTSDNGGGTGDNGDGDNHDGHDHP